MIDQKENMTQEEIQLRNDEYNRYVEEVTPVYSCGLRSLKAFVTGGLICLVGQVLLTVYGSMGAGKDDAALLVTISLVALSVVLTGFDIYPYIVKWGGAGALVPITGFANSVVSAAMEYKREGWVYGVGCKIFTIAGPVILYGIITSWALGVVYWLMQMWG
jgi:stage V sporulation protein AC